MKICIRVHRISYYFEPRIEIILTEAQPLPYGINIFPTLHPLRPVQKYRTKMTDLKMQDCKMIDLRNECC